MNSICFKIIFFACFSCTISLALNLNKSATIPSLSTNTQPGLPGGKSPLDLSDKRKLDEITKIAERSLLVLESEANDAKNSYKVIRIKEATSQVVAGFSHEIVFYVGECSNVTESNFTIENETLATNKSKKHGNNTDFLTKDEDNFPCTGNCTHNGNVTVSRHCSISDSGIFAICWVKTLEQEWTHTFKVKPSACKQVSKEEAYSTFENSMDKLF